MKLDNGFRQLVRTLPPVQQTLDFDDVDPWQSLPETDRHACHEAIAALLFHITSTAHQVDPQTDSGCNQENEHE